MLKWELKQILEKLRNQYTRLQPRLTGSSEGERASPSCSVDNDLANWAKLVPVLAPFISGCPLKGAYKAHLMLFQHTLL